MFRGGIRPFEHIILGVKQVLLHFFLKRENSKNINLRFVSIWTHITCTWTRNQDIKTAHQHNSCNYDLDSFSDESEDNSESKYLKTICLTSSKYSIYISRNVVIIKVYWNVNGYIYFMNLFNWCSSFLNCGQNMEILLFLV